MSEETTIETQTTETTEVTKPVEQVEPDTQPKPTEDLLERVSKFVEEKDPESKSPDNQASDQFNSAELDVTINGIEDPELKSKMEGLRKSLVSGANNKFQEIATLRKEMQASLERGTPEEWTPERVQKLANDPKFIEAAQSIASNETTDEYSSLSDVEKTNIKEMKDKIDKLEQMNVQSIHNQHQQRREVQHTALEAKYANYDRKEIDAITFDMLSVKGAPPKIEATVEHIYKAFKHDDNVKRAYTLGRKDEREGVQEKIDSTTVDGITTQASPEPIVVEKDETNKSFLDRIIAKNLKKVTAKS